MELRVLGQLEVIHRGRVIDLGPPKPRALLALLLLRPNEVVSADRLIEELWEEGAMPDDPVGALQIHVSRLRKTLAPLAAGQPLIVSERPGYGIRISPESLDAWRFQRLVTQARNSLSGGDPQGAVDTLVGALGLWRGPALAEFAVASSFVRDEVERLEDLRLAATEELMDARLALGHHRDLVGQLDAFVRANPLRERAWAARILALYRCGRQADALQAYQSLRRLLAEQLGIDPGPELVRLQEAILSHKPELEWRSAERLVADPGPAPSTPAATMADRRPDNLPLQLTNFVGRHAERLDLGRRLAVARLLTITGPAGSGKTRLALEVAAAADPPDGVWMVDLSFLADPTFVPGAIASAVGVREEAGVPLTEILKATLRGRDLLLVVDNCGRLLAACAELIVGLLQVCPALRVLTTSTEPLALPGEAVWPVPPLSLPPLIDDVSPEDICRSEAVELFVDRAVLVRADFALTAANAAAVALICRRLDGLPLPIELAAARVNALSPEEIAARLDDRFHLLTGGSPTVPARQQTLLAAVDWSHELLSASERAVLRRLSVFAGSCTVASAEKVCAGGEVEPEEVLDHLARLVAKSLLTLETSGLPARYRLLETIRQYGLDRLEETGEATGVRHRHARWSVELAELAEPELTGISQQAWLEQLDADRANLRAAFDWLMAKGHYEQALRLAGSLTIFWRVRCLFTEGREQLMEVLAVDAELPVPYRAKALWGAGFLTGMLDDYSAAIVLLQEGLADYRRLDDVQGCARSLLLLGNFHLFGEGSGQALGLLEESTALARAAGDSWCLAHSLALRGSACLRRGEIAAARPLLEECLAVARVQQDKQSLRIGLILLGSVALHQGDYGWAETLLEEGLAVTHDLGETYGTAAALTGLGELALGRGDYDRARDLLQAVLALEQHVGPSAGLVGTFCLLGRLAQAGSDLAGARRQFEAARSAAAQAGLVCAPALWGLGEVAQAGGDLAGARAQFDRALDLDRADGDTTARARGSHDLGNLARAEGDIESALDHHRQALRLRQLAGHLPGVVESLEALGGLAAASDRFGGAARLFATAWSVREVNGYALPPTARLALDADVAVLRDRMTSDEFEAAWAEGASLRPERAVSLALDLWD